METLTLALTLLRENFQDVALSLQVGSDDLAEHIDWWSLIFHQEGGTAKVRFQTEC